MQIFWLDMVISKCKQLVKAVLRFADDESIVVHLRSLY